MIVLIDTSTPVCKTWWIDETGSSEDSWLAEMGLADGLIGYLRGKLDERSATWSDVRGIGVFKGPGSFTGLRIGLTVMNTWADTEGIPIVGENGDDWREVALTRLTEGQNDELVMPMYGREANITKPRK